ncbi:MAG: radical SAM protein [Bdellovibrionales bacterium]|nr:radical SAM protein [Bdellovibrionales bacterium]
MLGTHPRQIKESIFYGQTTSLCETCLSLVPTKILFEKNAVLYEKRCKEHGKKKTLISSDIEYFKKCKDYFKEPDLPRVYQTETLRGCPYDCGLCPDHEQHSCLALIEVNHGCNLTCPVCFSESSPKVHWDISLEDFELRLDTLVESEGEPDLLQISGGEPTLHPQIIELIGLAKKKPIRHIMLNTNGIRLANDEEFVKELSLMKKGFEVYLQFDSLKDDTLLRMRGAKLTDVRKRALENLEKYGLSTTLVVVVKKGENDSELGAIIENALQYSCVRGVTFQPIQDTGRNETFDSEKHRIVLSEIRQNILDQTSLFSPKDIIPLPCNPETIAMAYGLRDKNTVHPITHWFSEDELLKNGPNTISYEKYPELKKHVFDLLSLSTAEHNSAIKLKELLCCLPQFAVPSDLGYDRVFRIVIMQFLDRFNFCIAQVKRSCVHFVTEKQKIIPFDTYNLFYREKL